jgi:hypothetical protein
MIFYLITMLKMRNPCFVLTTQKPSLTGMSQTSIYHKAILTYMEGLESSRLEESMARWSPSKREEETCCMRLRRTN